jgi:iron-sulfur cluster assembly accessory protein
MFRRSFARLCLSPSVGAYAATVTFTDRAWQRVAQVNRTEGVPSERALRMAIEPGGCQGFSYKFEFDNDIDTEEDVVFENTKVGVTGDQLSRIVIDRGSLEKLQGATIDYHSELKGSAFVVVGNELVDQACACAASFSIQRKKTPQ